MLLPDDHPNASGSVKRTIIITHNIPRKTAWNTLCLLRKGFSVIFKSPKTPHDSLFLPGPVYFGGLLTVICFTKQSFATDRK